jgi:hypothetical protein
MVSSPPVGFEAGDRFSSAFAAAVDDARDRSATRVEASSATWERRAGPARKPCAAPGDDQARIHSPYGPHTGQLSGIAMLPNC